jgi:hypothetical protein
MTYRRKLTIEEVVEIVKRDEKYFFNCDLRGLCLSINKGDNE